MSAPHLIYFSDPMCSWCYGFGPELSKLVERRPDLKLSPVMGGLRPYNRAPMTLAFRTMLREFSDLTEQLLIALAGELRESRRAHQTT